MRICRIAFVIVLLLPSALLAWGFHDGIGNGSPLLCVTTKSSAMGGVWSLPSAGAASIFLNPAELSMLGGPFINTTISIVQWSSYANGVVDFDEYSSGNTGAVTLAFGTEISDAVSVGAGITKVSEFGFDGIFFLTDEIGVNSYEVVAIDVLDAHGSLWEANTGVSVILNDWLTAGVSGGIRFGKGSWNRRHDIVDPLAFDDTTSMEWEEEDFCLHAGILMPLEFGTFGLSGTNATGRYRSRIAVGFQREFSILYGSTLGVEFDIQSIEEKNPAVSGRVFANLAEMMPHVRSTYSIGFNRASDYQHAAACLGTGAFINFGKLEIELGVSWMSRSRAGYAFPEPFITNIDDAGTYYSAGLSWKL